MDAEEVGRSQVAVELVELFELISGGGQIPRVGGKFGEVRVDESGAVR